MKYYLLLSLVLGYHISYSQHSHEVDSLRAILPQLADESRVAALMDLCYYTRQTDSEASLAYGNEAVALAQQLDNPALLGRAYKDLAEAFYGADRFETVISTYDQALAIFREINDQEQIAYVYNNLGSVYRVKGNFDTSLRCLFRSLALKDSLGGLKLNTTYTNIGETFRTKGDNAKALDYFFRALAIEEENGDQEGLAGSYNNIGITYEAQGDYERALEYGLKAMVINQERGDQYGYAISLNNLGEVYLGQGQHAQALNYYHQALSLKKN